MVMDEGRGMKERDAGKEMRCHGDKGRVKKDEEIENRSEG